MSFEAFGYVLDLRQLPSVATFVSGAAVAMAAISSLVSARLSFRGKVSPLPNVHAELPQMARVSEIKEALGRQEWIARSMGFTNGLLLFGQVVIGGILASAFVQDQMTKPITGLLGLLVLMSSLIHQQVRPDIKQRGSRRRVVQLRELLRETEDGIFDLRRNVPLAKPIEAIRRTVTTQLSRIERGEVEELPGEQQVKLPKLPLNPLEAAASRDTAAH